VNDSNAFATGRDDDPVEVLTEYRRVYEEHWAVAQSTRALASHADQGDAFERARVLRGEIARLFPHVDRHLRAVDIDVEQVSGGVRPFVLDRVIALAIERHRQRRRGLESIGAGVPSKAARPRRPALVLLMSLAALSVGGLGWGVLVAGWL
jgi:hypothetical protein